MMQITKIFHFEMAHAINGYAGACKNLHGHSYELHVSIKEPEPKDAFISAPGFIIDFKELKKMVQETVISILDHKMLLSEQYLATNKEFTNRENLVAWPMEPSAENILLFIKQQISNALPENVILSHLKLYETKDSYAEWLL